MLSKHQALRSPRVHRPRSGPNPIFLGLGRLHYRTQLIKSLATDCGFHLQPVSAPLLRVGSPDISPLPWVFSQNFLMNRNPVALQRDLL